MVTAMKIDSSIIWLIFTLDVDENAAKARFKKRTGQKPEFVERDHNYLWIGAKEEPGERNAQSRFAVA